MSLRGQQCLALAVRTVVETLEDRRLMASVASTNFVLAGPHQHVDVLLNGADAGQLTTGLNGHFSLLNLSQNASDVPMTKDSAASTSSVAVFKPSGTDPLIDGWYESYVRSSALDADEY